MSDADPRKWVPDRSGSHRRHRRRECEAGTLSSLRPPDLAGVTGRAWVRGGGGYGVSHAALREWFIYEPKSHPDVSWWFLFLLSLEHFPGVERLEPALRGAKYELNLTAIDPSSHPKSIADIEGKTTVALMEPIILTWQFGGIGDPQAAAIADGAVVSIVNGLLAPEDSWVKLWTVCMNSSVRHHQEQMS